MVVVFLCIYCVKIVHGNKLFPTRKYLAFCACTVDSFRHQHFWKWRWFMFNFFNVSDQIWRENDQIKIKLHSEYDYECIRNSLSTYPLLSRWAGVSNRSDMASSQSKQRTCVLILSADQCGFSFCSHLGLLQST